MSPKGVNLSDEDFALLARLEAGEHTFRPGTQPRPGESFEGLVAELLSLRERGLVRFSDSKIMTRTDGNHLGVQLPSIASGPATQVRAVVAGVRSGL